MDWMNLFSFISSGKTSFLSDLPLPVNQSGAGGVTGEVSNRAKSNTARQPDKPAPSLNLYFSHLTDGELRDYLINFRRDHAEARWPTKAEAEAAMLFGSKKCDAETSKALAIVYCFYTDFVANLDNKARLNRLVREKKSDEYLQKNPDVTAVLKKFFPVGKNAEDTVECHRLERYLEFCNKEYEAAVSDGKFELADSYKSTVEALVVFAEAFSML